MDLRKSINYISDIVANRPLPIRELDQIYMKHADMLLQIEHISKWISKSNIIFIGDGDAIALGLAYLQKNLEIHSSIQSILVVDFDERIVNSINFFAKSHKMQDLISARLYNVADALPIDLWHKYDAFYCNPPFGASNDGRSISSFMRRGFEATGRNAIGCVVLADDPQLPWTCDVLQHTQKYALDNGFIISEMVPQFHTYILEDDPDLTSCSIVFRRINYVESDYNSTALDPSDLEMFYGSHDPLKIQYVKDKTARKYINPDYDLIPITKENRVE